MDGLAGTIERPVLTSAGIEPADSAYPTKPKQVTHVFPPSKKG